MYLDVSICPECNRELSLHAAKCRYCHREISEPKYKSVFRWQWADRFILLALTSLMACFFVPWFPGEFLLQDTGFSIYALLIHIVDIEIDFLPSYNILRMGLILPLFSILLFFMVYFEENLKSSPFPGIFLFVILMTVVSLKLMAWLSGLALFAALGFFLFFLAWFFRRQYTKGFLGQEVHQFLFGFFTLTILIYLADFYVNFLAKLDGINLLHTWGFWVSLFVTLPVTLLALTRYMKSITDFWLTLFMVVFTIVAYDSLVKLFFYCEPFVFFADNLHEILVELVTHIRIVSISLVIAIAVGVPVGVYITRNPGMASIVLYASSIMITIPSIAMFGFMMPILSSIDNAWDAVNGIGIGAVPAVVALSLYSLLPIIRNTYIALKSVDPATLEAGKGMGMTHFQLLIQLQLPLAAPIIMAGVRTAVVMAIAIAAIAAYIGAGGLGIFVSEGLQLSTNSSVIAGALVMSLLAIVADMVLGKAEDWLTPDGLKITLSNG